MEIAVLLRNDLRLHDHPALSQAVLDGKILPVYVLEENLGDAFKYWTHRNLETLQSSFREIGGELFVSRLPLPETVRALQEELAITAVYFNQSHHPQQRIRDEEFALQLVGEGLIVRIFEGTMLLPPSESVKGNGEPYQVFSPFYKQFRTKSIPPTVPRIREALFVGCDLNIKSISTDITSLQLVPSIPWTHGMDEIWTPGEDAAIERIQTFIDEDVAAYKITRDFPAISGTSRISPYLAIGSLSVRSVYHYTLKTQPDVSEAFIRQLIWREFAYQMLIHFPHTVSKPLNPKFSKFPWLNNEEHYEQWCLGQTGVPLIDAGMRELLSTGYMHNRVRMNVASYLTKHLLIDFTKGMSWFWNKAIDADFANNTFGWQWTSGSGADASPYFRIFNPYLQSKKFDSEAVYIRKWVPELRGLSNQDIMEPDQASSDALEKAGVVLGETYPRPIVPHKAGRARALLAYEKIKK
ncbi:cryptochrome/photolyase family protein [Paenisporosarcina indica]|uniref:cryptochrome/photolyase family protein n=1 Tax=Paenisporosarcina indica TaxID=650093 RepID=UPI00094FC6B9|nr:deoxyribodipyrimidine photo-lyase [Paenisporosarcina indica]